MDAATRDFVRRRAVSRCEYCHTPEEATPFIAFHVEHIIARQHLPELQDDPSGLAYACDRCNAFKGPNLSSIDPETGEKVDLFNPRTQNWSDHFTLSEGRIFGLTSIGRATARLLNMNHFRRVELRLHWLDEGGSL
ncbi:MAG: HNH endonuclease [Planctomycetaceae bacterium]